LPSSSTSSAAPVIDEGALRAYRDIVARDPKNVQAAVSAANIMYDAQRYMEAIPLYQQAFALSPSDINIGTDLGTALWYSGRPDEVLAQYDKSLALNATHAQTLFNIGIVKSEGKRDYAGAVAAWEKLLATNPPTRTSSRSAA
jgi:tetratricopeptide (TPR) repeat protein